MRNEIETPLVSVLITAYNREQHIAETIESVLKSTYTNFELIIVDDCSVDSTVKIAKQYEAQDERIKVYVNEKNLGDYPNRNKAASFAKGKYLKYVDSDDIIYPFGLAMMVNRMEDFPEAGIALAKRGLKEKPFPVLLSPGECYELSFLKNSNIFTNAPTSAMIKREVFLKVGGFSGLNQLGDAEFWMKVAAIFPVLLVEGDVSWNRDHFASEKYKDNASEKAKLLYSINKKALNNTANPLAPAEKEAALKKLSLDFKKHRIKSYIRNKISGISKLSKMRK